MQRSYIIVIYSAYITLIFISYVYVGFSLGSSLYQPTRRQWTASVVLLNSPVQIGDTKHPLVCLKCYHVWECWKQLRWTIGFMGFEIELLVLWTCKSTVLQSYTVLEQGRKYHRNFTILYITLPNHHRNVGWHRQKVTPNHGIMEFDLEESRSGFNSSSYPQLKHPKVFHSKILWLLVSPPLNWDD